MKKILSILSVLVLMASMLSFPYDAMAGTKLKSTSITSITAINNGFMVKYKRVKNVTGYQIQYSTSSKLKKAKTVKVKKASTNKKAVKKLKANKKYYVRVRAYKTTKKGNKTITSYSAWSKKKSVKTKASATATGTSSDSNNGANTNGNNANGSADNNTGNTANANTDVIKNTDLKTPAEIKKLTTPPTGCVPTTGRTWNELFADPKYSEEATKNYNNWGETNPNARVDASITNNTNIATIPGTGNIAPAYVFPNYGKNCSNHDWMYVVTKNNGDMVFYETHNSAIQGTYCAECGYDGLTDDMRATKCYNEFDMGILQSDRTRNVAVHRMNTGHSKTACDKTLMEVDCNVYRWIQTTNKKTDFLDTHNYQFTRYCVNCGKWEIVLNNFQEITDCHGAAYNTSGKAVVIL